MHCAVLCCAVKGLKAKKVDAYNDISCEEEEEDFVGTRRIWQE